MSIQLIQFTALHANSFFVQISTIALNIRIWDDIPIQCVKIDTRGSKFSMSRNPATLFLGRQDTHNKYTVNGLRLQANVA